MNAYTAIYRKGCTPPDSVNWTNSGNNKAFLAQTVVMTANTTLSIPSALQPARPDDYYKNAATIDWPNAASGQPLVIVGYVIRGVVFKAGGNPTLAEDFVRFLAEEGWLAHWLDFAGDRFMPPMRKLARAAVLARPERPAPHARGDPDPDPAPPAEHGGTRPRMAIGPDHSENVWGQAVHRVVTEGISPEQAVDEAIARIKQILRE